MAITDNILFLGLSGKLGDQIVFKKYPGDDTKRVMAKAAKVSRVKKSEKQKEQQMSFKEAQHTARVRLQDPEVKAYWQSKCKPGKRAYNLLISELMKGTVPLSK